MATRFYLPSSGSVGASPAFSASWEDTSIAIRLPAVTVSSSTAMTLIAKNGDTDTNDSDHLYGQWVSAPLESQTIATQTVKLQMRGQEENDRANQTLAMCLRVVSGDGSTVRGTMRDIQRDNVEL